MATAFSSRSLETEPPRWLGLSKAQAWGLLLLLYTVIFVLDFGYRYLDDLSRQHRGTFMMRLLEEGTGVYIVFLLLPLVFRIARRYLFHGLGWIRMLRLHVMAAVSFSFLHTSLMAVSRWLIAPRVGLGTYNYGMMRYRYPMEFSNDLLSYTVIVLAFYFVERLRMAQAQQLAAAELQAQLAEAQLGNLRLQLQPHFLFNTLNTISAVMYEDLGAADRMLQKLSELLRATLRETNSQEVTLAEELGILRLYLEIMQQRFEEKLRVTYSVASGIEQSLVPQLILQPLVENSIRHGMKEPGLGIQIAIGARREDGNLILEVADTGGGFKDSDWSAKGRGLGIDNIRGRLERLYGDQQEFGIANRDSGGAQVIMRLPFHLAPQPV